MKKLSRIAVFLTIGALALMGVIDIAACARNAAEPDFIPHEVLAAQPQAINLAEGLRPEAQRIVQLFMNIPGGYPSVLFQGNSAVPTYQWPERTTIIYDFPVQKAGQRYIRLTLSDIKVTNFSPLSWGDAEVVNDDTVSQVITTVDIPAATSFKRTFEYHFGRVETLQDSTTKGFEAEATLKLGNEYSPVNIDIATRVKEEATRTFGTEQTFESSDSQEFSFEGPRSIRIEAVRDRQQLRRQVSSRPIVDYVIRLSTQYEQVAEACWQNKEELLAYFQGAVSDDVGQLWYHYRGRITAKVPTAGHYREHPQDVQNFGETLPLLVFPADYTTVTNQSIIAKDITP